MYFDLYFVVVRHLGFSLCTRVLSFGDISIFLCLLEIKRCARKVDNVVKKWVTGENVIREERIIGFG